jgi:hypothetical protein
MYLAQEASTTFTKLAENSGIRLALSENQRPEKQDALKDYVGDKVFALPLVDLCKPQGEKKSTSKKIAEIRADLLNHPSTNPSLTAQKSDRESLWTRLIALAHEFNPTASSKDIKGRETKSFAFRMWATTSTYGSDNSRGAGLVRIAVAALVQEFVVQEYRSNLLTTSPALNTLRQNISYLLTPYLSPSQLTSDQFQGTFNSVWYIFIDWINATKKPTFESLTLDNEDDPDRNELAEYFHNSKRNAEQNLNALSKKLANMPIFKQPGENTISSSGKQFISLIIRVTYFFFNLYLLLIFLPKYAELVEYRKYMTDAPDNNNDSDFESDTKIDLKDAPEYYYSALENVSNQVDDIEKKLSIFVSLFHHTNLFFLFLFRKIYRL